MTSKVQKVTMGSLNVVAFLIVLLAGLKMVFRWDWNPIFTTVIIVLVAVYLLFASGINSLRIMTTQLKKNAFYGVMNLLMFAVGLLMVYIAITSLPALNAIAIPAISTFNGWILIAGGALALLDIFNYI